MFRILTVFALVTLCLATATMGKQAYSQDAEPDLSLIHI